jgi:hypothetical protein
MRRLAEALQHLAKALRVIGMSASSLRYQPAPDRDTEGARRTASPADAGVVDFAGRLKKTRWFPDGRCSIYQSPAFIG